MGGTRQRETKREKRETRTSKNATASRTIKAFEQLQQINQHETKDFYENSLPVNWMPGEYFTFAVLLAIRLCAAGCSSINDCDETFNYWEPTHFLAYEKGHQTWEYDPAFALRSYFYLLIHRLGPYLYNILGMRVWAFQYAFQYAPAKRIIEPGEQEDFNRVQIFHQIKCTSAVICSLCEICFYYGVKRELGPNTANHTLWFSIMSAGMFISSTAFLPSTTSMFLVMLSHAAWFNRYYALAIFATALSCFLSWPFAALLGVPIAMDILFRQRKVVFFMKWCIISAVTILIPQIAIDSEKYGHLVSAPFNIVKYNVFTEHGPDLYGREPWTYYLLNGILNFNGAFALALLVMPIYLLVKALVPVQEASRKFLPVWMVHLALHLWLLVFGLQSHKEERFLYPIYPLLCLAAATTVDYLQKIYFFIFVREKIRHFLDHTQWISVVILGIFGALSLSRVFALYHNYHAPMDVWMHVAHLPQMENRRDMYEKPFAVCVGKEWHRYPSSFFLPNNNWDLKYIRSEFTGQLPQPYDVTDLKESTRVIRNTFNDKNKQELNRFVQDPIKECDYIVDQAVHIDDRTELEPDFGIKDPNAWKEEFSIEFLDAKRSPQIFRAFYVPFFSRSRCTFNNYTLYKNVSPKQSTKRKFRKN